MHDFVGVSCQALSWQLFSRLPSLEFYGHLLQLRGTAPATVRRTAISRTAVPQSCFPCRALARVFVRCLLQFACWCCNPAHVRDSVPSFHAFTNVDGSGNGRSSRRLSVAMLSTNRLCLHDGSEQYGFHGLTGLLRSWGVDMLCPWVTSNLPC